MTMTPSWFTPTMASGAASSIAWKVDSPVADDVSTESNPLRGSRGPAARHYRGSGLLRKGPPDGGAPQITCSDHSRDPSGCLGYATALTFPAAWRRRED